MRGLRIFEWNKCLDREVKALPLTPLKGFHLTWKLKRRCELVIYHSHIPASYSKQN
jgi:hypothetical protein